MPNQKINHEIEMLQHQLQILELTQERDVKTLRNYEEKIMPAYTKFLKHKRHEIRNRAIRIEAIKVKLEALQS